MYRVKEIFATLQGEGHHTGTAAVFVRFVGCNMWSGRSETRLADAENNRAACALWCDTDFVGGTSMSLGELMTQVDRVARDAGMAGAQHLVVFTGGEPLLQLDVALLDSLREWSPTALLAIETNGRTTLESEVAERLDWVCVSPKGAPDQLVVREGDELKLVWPAYSPEVFTPEKSGLRFTHWYLQPEAAAESEVGESQLQPDVMAKAADYCIGHPTWRLSIQTHKIINLP
jgi:organic radical activating enzyme